MNRRAEPAEPNPWVTVPDEPAEPVAPRAAAPPSYVRLGPARPLAHGVATTARGLGFWRPDNFPTHPWWWVNCHGGAGGSTLCAAIGRGGDPAAPGWPVPPVPAPVRVVLVARTHGRGLNAAQEAATQWASGAVPHVDLLGLVAVADAPGKLPRPLRDALRFVAGGVPRVWHVPWVEPWRLCGTPRGVPQIRATAQLAAELAGLVAEYPEVP